jgi:hypothetical protein
MRYDFPGIHDKAYGPLPSKRLVFGQVFFGGHRKYYKILIAYPENPQKGANPDATGNIKTKE